MLRIWRVMCYGWWCEYREDRRKDEEESKDYWCCHGLLENETFELSLMCDVCFFEVLRVYKPSVFQVKKVVC